MYDFGGEMCGYLTFCVTGELSQYFLNPIDNNSHAVKYTVTIDVSCICFLLTETPSTETIISVWRASVDFAWLQNGTCDILSCIDVC
jgi:hypothetical protein